MYKGIILEKKEMLRNTLKRASGIKFCQTSTQQAKKALMKKKYYIIREK